MALTKLITTIGCNTCATIRSLVFERCRNSIAWSFLSNSAIVNPLEWPWTWRSLGHKIFSEFNISENV